VSGATGFIGRDLCRQLLERGDEVIALSKGGAPLASGAPTIALDLAGAMPRPQMLEGVDVVFHLGAINLFRDKKSAIDEMIRVARPGTRIVIADESEKASRLFAIFVGHHDPVVPPVDLIPANMLEVNLKSIWNEYGYLITFRKPA